VRHEPLFNAISAAAMALISEFNSQNLGNTAWAFAALGYTNMPFLQAIAAESIKKMQDFVPQELSNMAWAFAKLG